MNRSFRLRHQHEIYVVRHPVSTGNCDGIFAKIRNFLTIDAPAHSPVAAGTTCVVRTTLPQDSAPDSQVVDIVTEMTSNRIHESRDADFPSADLRDNRESQIPGRLGSRGSYTGGAE